MAAVGIRRAEIGYLFDGDIFLKSLNDIIIPGERTKETNFYFGWEKGTESIIKSTVHIPGSLSFSVMVRITRQGLPTARL